MKFHSFLFLRLTDTRRLSFISSLSLDISSYVWFVVILRSYVHVWTNGDVTPFEAYMTNNVINSLVIVLDKFVFIIKVCMSSEQRMCITDPGATLTSL